LIGLPYVVNVILVSAPHTTTNQRSLLVNASTKLARLAAPAALVLFGMIAIGSPAAAESWSHTSPKVLKFRDVSAAEFREIAGLPATATASYFRQEVELEHQPPADPLAVDAPTSPEGAESMLKADVQTPGAVTRFNAVGWGLGADVSVAASKTHVMVTSRNGIVVSTKGGLKLAGPIDSMSLLGLVAPPGIDSGYDGRVLFDESTGRFFYGSLIYNSVAVSATDPTAYLLRRSKFALAVSKSGDPFAGWYLYVWDAVPGDGVPGNLGFVAGRGSDYDTMGIAKGFFMQANPVGQPGYHDSTQLTVWKSADLAAGKTQPVGVLFYDILASDGSKADLQPARHHGVIPGTAVGGSAWLVGRVGAASLDIWELRQTAPGPVYSLLRNTVKLSRAFSTPPRVEQKGSPQVLYVDNVGTIALHAVARGDSLYVTTQDAVNWEGDKVLSSARYIQLKRSGSSTSRTYTVVRDRTFGSRSAIYDEPSDRVHYVYPFVEVNKLGDAVIVYGRSSPNHYPEVSFSSFPAASADILPSRKLQVGLGPVAVADQPEFDPDLVQLYDYNGVAVDPFDDTAIWIAAPYGYVSGEYRIAVGKVYGKPVPDLVVPMTSADVPAVLHGATSYPLTLRFANYGDGPAVAQKATVTLRKSTTWIETTLATVSVPALAALTGTGKPTTVATTVTIPSRPSPGTYYLTVRVDSEGKVAEYEETNNSKLYVVTVQ
jgi:hypothetical protein